MVVLLVDDGIYIQKYILPQQSRNIQFGRGFSLYKPQFEYQRARSHPNSEAKSSGPDGVDRIVNHFARDCT